MAERDNPSSSAQETLLQSLRARGLLKTPRLDAAFRAVPRHPFLPNLPLEEVYEDEAIPIKYDSDGRVISSSSQPSMMVMMLEQLDLQPGHNVLEIGAGTGYNAAIMQHIVGQRGRVTTVEFDHLITQQAIDNLQRAGFYNVLVVKEDGIVGYAPRAAYDRILATVGVWDIPTSWKRQLKQDGMIVAPIMIDGAQVSAAFRCDDPDQLYSDDNIPCGFVLMQGASAVPGIFKRIGSTSMTLSGIDVSRLDTAALHLLLSADHDECQLTYAVTAEQIWRGLSFYIMLNHSPEYTFALYMVSDDQKAYGIEGGGVALLSPGSACLIPYREKGITHCFAGADSFMEVERLVNEWVSIGSPGAKDLRVRLIPKSMGKPEITQGRVYERGDHYLHAWLEAAK